MIVIVAFLLWRQCSTLCTFYFVDDVLFAHNRPGKSDASGAYTQSDSQRASTGDEVWCLWLRLCCWVSVERLL